MNGGRFHLLKCDNHGLLGFSVIEKRVFVEMSKFFEMYKQQYENPFMSQTLIAQN